MSGARPFPERRMSDERKRKSVTSLPSPANRAPTLWQLVNRAVGLGRRLIPKPVPSQDRHILYHVLREALAEPRCPLCSVLERRSRLRMEGVFRELVNDPDTRAILRASLGYCRIHTVLALECGDALGLSLLYGDLTEHASLIVQRARQSFRASSVHPCPECVHAQQDLEEITAALAAYLADSAMQSAYTRSAGLCVAHLLGVLALASPSVRSFLADQETERLLRLHAELQEFVRKSDARYHHEPIGAEGDAYLRAAARLAGLDRPPES